MRKHLFSIKIFLLFVFVVGIAVPVFAKPGAWLGKIKKVEVLKSTKAEVEKLFGNPTITEVEDLAVVFKNGYGKEVIYETAYGRLEVWYAAGKCAENKGRPYAFDIAADVVVSLTFFPNEIVFANQLGYNLEKFKQEGDSETDRKYSFETDKSGVEIEVADAKVESVYFFVTEQYHEKLYCKDFKVKEPDWLGKLRKLELFKATRGDLEILFESPRIIETEDDTESGGSIEVEYETLDGALTVEYSTGKCSERKSKYGYDAERNTILKIEFEPTVQSDLTEINYDLRAFEYDRNACMPAVSTRRSRQFGIGFVIIDSKINEVEFFPNEKQAEEFDCEKVLSLQN